MPAAANFSHSARIAVLAAVSSSDKGSCFVVGSFSISIGFSYLKSLAGLASFLAFFRGNVRRSPNLGSAPLRLPSQAQQPGSAEFAGLQSWLVAHSKTR